MTKKTLINEVLPTPTAASRATLRDRVVRHAQKVLKNSAIGGTAALAGCAGIGISGADQDAGKNGQDAGNDAGYTVVHPLPPPGTMYDPAAQATGSATVAGDGKVTVRVL